MTKTEFLQMLADIESAKIPITYYSYPDKEAPPLPYAVYYNPNTRTEPADDLNFARIHTLIFELYTDDKDFELEETFEGILNDYSLVYDKNENFLDSETMYQIVYETEDIETWAASDTD